MPAQSMKVGKGANEEEGRGNRSKKVCWKKKKKKMYATLKLLLTTN